MSPDMDVPDMEPAYNAGTTPGGTVTEGPMAGETMTGGTTQEMP